MKKYKETITNSVTDGKVNSALQNISSSISQSVVNSNATLTQLQSALQMYKEALDDYIQLSVEKSTLSAKYSNDNAGNPYDLPGVFSSTMGTFDLGQMKIDNQRIEEILPLLDQAESQKDLYFKMIQNARNSLSKDLANIIQNSVNLEAFLTQLEEFSGFDNKFRNK